MRFCLKKQSKANKQKTWGGGVTAMRWLTKEKGLPARLTWIQALKPTWWWVKIDSCKSFYDTHTPCTCMHIYINNTYMQTRIKKEKKKEPGMTVQAFDPSTWKQVLVELCRPSLVQWDSETLSQIKNPPTKRNTKVGNSNTDLLETLQCHFTGVEAQAAMSHVIGPCFCSDLSPAAYLP